MRKKLIIKSFKVNANSNDSISKAIVVGFSASRVNSYYIEKVGSYSKHQNNSFFYVLKLSRIGYWLNRGAIIKPRISWVIGLLGKGLKLKLNVNKK